MISASRHTPRVRAPRQGPPEIWRETSNPTHTSHQLTSHLPEIMPHLCFTPLSTTTHHNISLGDSSSSSAVEKSCSLAPILFIREVNTKSSFALELPIAWLLRETICEGDADLREAEACISSYNTHTSNDSIDDSVYETFLFGGFELIANVKTVEVYAVRSLDSTTTTAALADGEETYLTTCKGLPMRDLPALPIIPHCIEGTTTATATATTTISNIQNGDDGEGINKITEPENELYYKFIFVLPGGPKPMERVRLKFVQPIDNNNHDSLIIIVRTLKVKGRLSDAMSPTKAKPTPSIIANSSEGTNSNNIINDLATGGGNRYNMSTTADGQSKQMGLQMDQHQRQDVCRMIPQEVRQMIPPSLSSSSPLPRNHSLSMKQQQQQQQQQHNNHHQHERNQAEIMSTLAGLGMFLRSSEERMTMKIETMLSGMETRINERLDDVVARIDEFDVRSKGSTNT